MVRRDVPQFRAHRGSKLIFGTAAAALVALPIVGAHGRTNTGSRAAAVGAPVKTTSTISKAFSATPSKPRTTTKRATIAPVKKSLVAAPVRPRATLPPTSKTVKKVAVTETWTVNRSLQGWAALENTSWPESGRALVIEARAKSIEVRQAPSVAAPGLLFAKGRSTTGPVTFLAVRDYGEWVQVLLPVRPNGTLGWVKGAEVSRIAVTHRILVDLSSNTMQIENDAAVVGTYPISTGTGGTPTPTGLFYVRELVVQTRTDGPYGPFVFGLSGYSEVLNDFDGGEGAIGIHGTNRPDAIGDSVSHGCIRMTNDAIVAVSKTLPLGTPVEVVKSLADLPTKRRAMAEPEADPSAPPSVGGIVIDFPLLPAVIPERRLEDADIVDVAIGRAASATVNPTTTKASTPASASTTLSTTTIITA